MSATNFYVIRERVQDALYGARAVLLRGTVDSGDTDTLVDAAAALPTSTADHFDNGAIKIRQTTDNLAPQNETRAIDESGFTVATGSFETVPFTVTLTAGDNYEIWPNAIGGGGWHPDAIDLIANKLLRGLHMPSFFPLTLDLQTNDDNDMEASGVTGWTAGTATPTKSATAYNGAQSITQTGSGVNDYITAGNFPVFAGESYYVAVMNQVDSGDSARVRMIDSTNSATIKDSGNTTQEAWTEIVYQWTAPSGCRQAQARLMCVASGDIARWDDYQVWRNNAGVYPLPSWITRKEQLLGVFAFPRGTGAPVADTFVSDEMKSYELPYRFERADTRATSELSIYVPSCGDSRPYIRAYRPLTEVSFDYGSAGVGAGALGSPANTIPLSSTEADALVLGVMAELHRQSATATVGEQRNDHIRQQRDFERAYFNGTNHLRPEWRETRVQHNRVAGVIP